MSISNVISNTVEALAHGCFSRLLRNFTLKRMMPMSSAALKSIQVLM